MTAPVSMGFAGSSNTANISNGYRPLAMDNFLVSKPRYLPTFTNIAMSGWTTWPALVNLADLSGSQLLIFDQSNDDSSDQPHVEALIRNAWAIGQRVISVVLPAWTAVNNSQVNTPANQTAIEQHRTVCNAYGIPMIDFWAMCQALVPGTYNLSDLYSDTAHPSTLGMQLIEAILQPYLPSGGGAALTPLPTRVYAASEDFQQTPVVKNGTDYDSKTGTWTVNGTSISSSTAGDTITFSGTFRSFGCYRADATYPNISVSIDGGAYIDGFAFYANGYDIGVRAAHTVTIKVATTCKIDEFWAI